MFSAIFNLKRKGKDMKKLVGIAVGVLALGMVATAQGEDCPGTRWRNSGGKSCRDLGLDSQRGTCIPGDEYETLCDDMQNMIKTCRGPRRCQEEVAPRGRHREREERYRDDDRRQEPCDWDYIYNQPCPRGYINFDCAGGCERADRGGWR